MNRIKKYALLAAACVLAVGLTLAACAMRRTPGQSAAVPAPAQLRGVLVRTGPGEDIPFQEDQAKSAVRDRLAQMVTFAKESGLNTILFEARPSGEVFYRSEFFPYTSRWGSIHRLDPLEELVKLAATEGIQVLAVVDPYNLGERSDATQKDHPINRLGTGVIEEGGRCRLDPASPDTHSSIAGGAAEIAGYYGVAGVVYNFTDAAAYATAEQLQSLLTETRTAMGGVQAADKTLGLLCPPALLPDAADGPVSRWMAEGTVDLLLGADPAGDGSAPLQWAAKGTTTAVLLDGEAASRRREDGALLEDPYALCYTLLHYGEVGVKNTVLTGYRALRENPIQTAALLSPLYQGEVTRPQGLSLPQGEGLFITRPTKTLATSYSKYFITGRSQPEEPLYLNGEEVERRSQIGRDENGQPVTAATASGLFGVLVEVPYGTNTYRFTQNGQEETVTIIRNRPSGGSGTIQQITASSAFPATPSYAKVGEPVTLRCVAPSGGSVRVNIEGKTVVLDQVAATAQSGIPAVYSAEYTPDGSYPADEMTNLGKLTYTLTYQGKVTTRTSAADLLMAGSHCDPVIRVEDYMAGVTASAEAADEGNFLTTLKQGDMDYVVGQESTHFQLKSGGYIRKNAVALLEGKADAHRTLSAITHRTTEKDEIFTLAGAAGAASAVDWSEGLLTVTLYNTLVETEAPVVESALFGGLTLETGPDGSLVLVLPIRTGATLWGYDLTGSGTDLVLTCRKKPALSSTPGKPLEGITVVLDPGHGGRDPGALGLNGEEGPFESDLNLAAAYAAQHSLEQLGATVFLTHRELEGEQQSLFERMEAAEKTQPDFFLSLHHNSTAENSDGNKNYGTEVYYYTNHSRTLAQAMAGRLSTSVGRLNRGAMQSYYVVTKMTRCPAILTEIGFVVNPAEYESLLDGDTLYRTGNAVASAVLDALLIQSSPAAAVPSDQTE